MKKNFMLVCIALLLAMTLIVSCDNSSKDPDAGKFTVTFDTSGGSIINPIKVGLFQTVTLPEKPIRDGYFFIEWQLDGKKYDFNTPVTKNITLKAIWEFNGEKVSDAESLKAAITAGKNALLLADIELSESLTISKSVLIELNNKKLSFKDGNTIDINGEEGTVFRIINGQISGTGFAKNTKSFISITKGNTISINDTVINNDGTALFPQGDAAKVLINNSTINALGYAIATNAASSNNYNVSIEINNSHIIVPDEERSAGTAIIVNVPCTLKITNSEIVGRFHGIIIRGGDATITNSSITNIVDGNDLLTYFDNRNWGSGNEVNLSAITFGNKHTTSYQYPTTVEIDNCTIKSVTSQGDKGAYPAIYGYGNSSEDLKAKLTYKNCNIIGDVIPGNAYAIITDITE